ncbi:MAG: hypothetical protein II992_05170 [Lachnospiraceae bacterium]|nr:hypothetical protein [Lachnospiraceae bacterium]
MAQRFMGQFRVAIKKWTEDRDFIAGYQLSENRKVIVNKVTKGKKSV